jgi:hypothetical protein
MDIDQLLDRIVQGDSSVTATLLTRHQKRLRRMVYLRIDPRLDLSQIRESGVCQQMAR